MLTEPFEIFELRDQESQAFRVAKWEKGEMIIHPRDGRGPKAIDGLRVYVPVGHKTYEPFWWDITSKRLIAMLMPHLERPGFEGQTFVVTKHGDGPGAHFSLEVK